jgi:hypothetical protein
MHGLSRVLGVSVPLVMLACLLDWGFHLDALVRLAALVAICGTALWLSYRYVMVPLVVRFRDLDIALRIEERWPGLNDRLASTVQFLRLPPADERIGSPALREATIQQTLKEAEVIDFRKVIEPKPVLEALWFASITMLCALLLLLASPSMSTIALRRLFMPFGPDRWPQQTHIALIEKETPRKVARGDPFTLGVSVAKGDRVPAGAKAVYRFADGETMTESLRTAAGGIFRGRLESVNRPFRFSVTAGDDNTSIRDVAVAVVPPPAITQLTIRVVPPKYTGLPPELIETGHAQIRAVEGTVIELAALANKPIYKATLRVGDEVAPAVMEFTAGRTRFSTSFTVKQSAPFWFELRDTEGFRNHEVVRYELRASRDEAPRVVIDEPPNDRDVPAKATVPIAFTVDDDFGIHSARVLYKVATGDSEPSREVVLGLYSAEPKDGRTVKHKEVRYEWDLTKLDIPAAPGATVTHAPLPPGSVITFHADARDFDDLRGPNLGKSRELRLRILSDEDINRQLDDQRREIREDVARILAMQEQAKTPVDDALRTLSRTDRLPTAMRDELRNAELIQRQVGNRVSNRTDGLDHKVRKYIDDLKNFKLPNPDAQQQMEEMRAGIGRIRENHLEPAEQGLTRASKRLDEPAAANGSQPQGKTPETGAQPANDAARKDGENPPAQQGQPKAQPNQPANAKDQGASAKADGQPEAKAGTPQSKGQTGQPQSKGQAGQPQSKGQDGQPQSNGQRGQPESRDQRQAPGERAQPPQAADARSPQSDLKEAQDNQKAIVSELQKMLDGLSEFETYRGVVKDVQNLQKEQDQAIKQANELAAKPEMMGKTPDQLTPEQKADLGNLAARQSNVSKGLQNVQEKMNDMAKRTEKDDPLAASALRGAAEDSRKKGTAGKMSEAADQLERNQMGTARENQERARQDLKDLADAIQNRRERELSRLVKELKNAENELQKLRERQAQLRKQTRDAQRNPDAKERAQQLQRLAKEQAELEKELDRQLQRLAKLNAETAARMASRASGKMSRAQQQMEQGQGDQAGQQQEDALADLEDAQERLRQTRKDAEEMLAMEQLSRMGDHLISLAERQEKIVTGTADYEKLRTAQKDKLTLAQRKGIIGLGRVQSGLKDETGELIEKLEGAPVFALTLKRATEGMDTAAQRLQVVKTDDETRRAADSAAKRFRQLLDSLKADNAKGAGGQPPGGGGDGGGGAGGNNGGGDGIPAAAQVKMLKSLQQEINEKTEYFDELKRRKKELTPAQNAELERLHVDQGTLADLVRDLTRPRHDDGEE